MLFKAQNLLEGYAYFYKSGNAYGWLEIQRENDWRELEDEFINELMNDKLSQAQINAFKDGYLSAYKEEQEDADAFENPFSIPKI